MSGKLYTTELGVPQPFSNGSGVSQQVERRGGRDQTQQQQQVEDYHLEGEQLEGEQLGSDLEDEEQQKATDEKSSSSSGSEEGMLMFFEVSAEELKEMTFADLFRMYEVKMAMIQEEFLAGVGDWSVKRLAIRQEVDAMSQTQRRLISKMRKLLNAFCNRALIEE